MAGEAEQTARLWFEEHVHSFSEANTLSGGSFLWRVRRN